MFAAALGMGACREGIAPGARTLTVPAPQQLLVQLSVEPHGATGEYLLRVVTRSGAGVREPSAYQAQLHLPPGALVVSDVMTATGMIVAARLDGNVLRVAGARVEASGASELFAVRLRAPSIESLDEATVALSELVDAAGADLRPTLRIVDRPARLRGATP
jgi:hypothetical protein